MAVRRLEDAGSHRSLRRVGAWVGVAMLGCGCSGPPGTSGADTNGDAARGGTGSSSGGTGDSSTQGAREGDAGVGDGAVGDSTVGDGAASSCGQVAACGGDIVGSWTIVDRCASGSESSAPDSSCPNSTLQVTSTHASGTVQFNADMTWSSTVSGSTTETQSFPVTCLSGGEAGITCEEYATAFNGADDAGTGTATCTPAGSNCECDIASSSSNVRQTGTYATSGTTLTTTPSGNLSGDAGVTVSGYCVLGDALHVLSMTGSGTGAIGDLVATRTGAGDAGVADAAGTADGAGAGADASTCSLTWVIGQYPQDAVACIENDCTSQFEACGSSTCDQCMPALSACANELCLGSDDAGPPDDAGCSACQSVAQCCADLGQIYGAGLQQECTEQSSDCANEATCESLLLVYGASCP